MNRPTARAAVWVTSYLLAAAIALALLPERGPASWYLPIAIGIGLLYANGLRWAPVLLALEIVISWVQGPSGPAGAVAVAVPTVLEEVVGAWLVLRFRLRFESADDALALGVIATATAGVGAALGTLLSLPVGQAVAPGQLLIGWWAGDVTAIATVLPLVLLAARSELGTLQLPQRRWRWAEIALILGATLGVVAISASTRVLDPAHAGGSRFLWALPVLWAAVRYERALTAFTAFLLALVVFVSYTQLRLISDAYDQAVAQLALIAISLIGLAVAATLAGRRRAIASLEHTIAALDASEQRYTSLFEASPAMQLLVDPESGAIVDANEATASFYGYSRERLRTMNVADLNTAPDRIADIIERSRLGTVRELVEHRLASGERRRIEINPGPLTLGGRVLLHTFLRDATAEVEARAEVARLAAAVESSVEAIVTTDLDGRVTGWNAAAVAISGYTREEALGRNVNELGGPIPMDDAELAELIGKGSSVRFRRIVRAAAAGDPIPVDLVISPIVDDGRVVGMSRIAHDVRHLVREEERLRRSEALLNDAAEIGGIGSWELDPATGAVTWSDELYRIAGLEPGTPVTARTLADLAHPDDRALVEAALAVRENGVPRITFRLLDPSGAERAVVAAWRQIAGPDGSGRREVGVLRDATEERALEAQLRQAQRLESIGLLAGGVAQDFNNLLTAIGGFTELARVAAADGGSPESELIQVLAAVERARALTAQLLAFGRRTIVRPRDVDLTARVAALVPMLRRVVGDRIAVETELQPGVVALIDPGQLDQVIVNLALNARDAMPAGGRLRMAIGTVTAGDGAVRRAWIEIEDDGTGIPPELLERIFLPFVTTKEDGQASGLGLSTVEGIVGMAGGTIDVRSRVGEGTTFRIELPAREPAAVEAPSPPVVAGTGDIEVLLVDDEELVRRVGERVLQRAGFRVTPAAGVAEALARADLGRPDVLVTDVVLPGERDGIELAALLRERWPDLPVVVTTGFTERAVPPWATLLVKPYDLEELVATVRRLAAGAPPVDEDAPPAR